MREQARSLMSYLDHQLPCPTHLELQALVLPAYPPHQVLIQRVEHRVQRRPIEATVVVQPPPQHRIDLLRHVSQLGGVPAVQPPPAHRLPDRPRRARTDRRQEAHEHSPCSRSCEPRPEAITQEVELIDAVCPLAVAVATVDYLRLLRMQHKRTLRHPIFQGRPECLRLVQSCLLYTSDA